MKKTYESGNLEIITENIDPELILEQISMNGMKLINRSYLLIGNKDRKNRKVEIRVNESYEPPIARVRVLTERIKGEFEEDPNLVFSGFYALKPECEKTICAEAKRMLRYIKEEILPELNEQTRHRYFEIEAKVNEEDLKNRKWEYFKGRIKLHFEAKEKKGLTTLDRIFDNELSRFFREEKLDSPYLMLKLKEFVSLNAKPYLSFYSEKSEEKLLEGEIKAAEEYSRKIKLIKQLEYLTISIKYLLREKDDTVEEKDFSLISEVDYGIRALSSSKNLLPKLFFESSDDFSIEWDFPKYLSQFRLLNPDQSIDEARIEKEFEIGLKDVEMILQD